MAGQGLSWLDARPSVRVAFLSVVNALRRWRLAAAVFACAFAALSALGRLRAVLYVIALGALSPRWVVVVTMVLAATLALRRRQRFERHSHRHWLAALPRDISLLVRSARGPLLLWSSASVLIVSMSAVAAAPWWVPALVVAYGFLGVAIGVVLAGAVAEAGAWRMRRGAGNRHAIVRSSYTPLRAVRADWAHEASVAPLGFWALAATHARDRSRVRTRTLALLLLAVPMGVSGGVALAIAAVWLVISHLINLLVAVLRTVFSAAWWLAPTPLATVRFTFAVSLRALGAQMGACALLFAIGYVALGPVHARTIGVLVLGWLVSVGVLGTLTGAVALRTRSIAASPLHRWPQ